jgi:hypothetical protein
MIILSLSSCSSPDEEFRKAEKENTTSAYKDFLKKFPGGNLAQKAIKYLEKVGWENAVAKNEIQTYQDYISDFPESIHLSAAKTNIGKLVFKKIMNKFIFKNLLFELRNKYSLEKKTGVSPSPSMTIIYNVSPRIPITLGVNDPSLENYEGSVDLSSKPDEIWTLVTIAKEPDGKIACKFDPQGAKGFSVPDDWVVDMRILCTKQSKQEEFAAIKILVTALFLEGEDLRLEFKKD